MTTIMHHRKLMILAPLAVTLTWVGCNQILGNEVYQSAASSSDGGASASSSATSSSSATAGTGGASPCVVTQNADPKHCGVPDRVCLPGNCVGGICDAEIISLTVTADDGGTDAGDGGADAGDGGADAGDGGVNKPPALPPWSLAVASDDTAMIWTDPEQGRVFGCPLIGTGTNHPGCAVSTLETAPAQKYPASAIYAAGTHYFHWVTYDVRIASAPEASLSTTTTTTSAPLSPGNLGVDPSGVLYWTKGSSILSCAWPGCTTPGAVVGPAADTLDAGLHDPQVSPDGRRLAWDDHSRVHVCALDASGDAGGCDVSASYPGVGAHPADAGVFLRRAGKAALYYIIGGALYRTAYAAPDAAPEQEADYGAESSSAVTDDAVYFVSSTQKAIFRVKESCQMTTAETLPITISSSDIRAIAVSNNYVYWIDAAGGFKRAVR